MHSKERFAQAVSRTRARYATAPRGDRYYVASKLRFDPIARLIDEATEALGNVFDVGCGRGQLGLLLYELGKVHQLGGFDWDERKVHVAQAAAMSVGRYVREDVRTAAIPTSDTIIIADVLHYLSFEDQDALLARAAAALSKGGTLIVRDVDARRTLASHLTRACERIGVRLRVNRGQKLSFRSREEQLAIIDRVGLVIKDVLMTPGSSLDNVLIVAEYR